MPRTREETRRRFIQPVLPNLYFNDGSLSIPGFTFEKATRWEDTGSQTLIAEGTNLKDGSNVLAKIAPATGSGAICLEREAHILDRLSNSSDASNVVVRIIDFLSLPKESGDCVVLLLAHPGVNVLGRYFPPSKVNELLLSDASRVRPTSSHGDVYMMGVEETSSQEELEQFDIMDLATFLEFAIQATHCLEVIHKEGIVHREVRANAFHLNAHAGLVRFAHFGNRSISLEQLGGPSALVIAADTLEELSKHKVKEALCYLAPEQTGSVDTSQEDHRTDLYSLGIMFWTLLVGQGQMPFEGSPMEILHAIAQKRPMPVHEFRRDVPHVVALIIEKLLNKSPDARYNSAYGLKADLLECQRRLLTAVSSMSEQSLELIPAFEIGKEDKFMGFTIPNMLFGREKELETVRNVIRRISASHARQYEAQRSSVTMTSSSSQYTANSLEIPDDHSDSAMSSRSGDSPKNGSGPNNGESSVLPPGTRVASLRENSPGSFSSSYAPHSEGVRSRSGRRPSKTRISRTRSVIITGPAGAGKSSLILTNQAKWRSHGLWGHAKFQNAAAAPFAALLSCLSSVLRQLMIFQSDLHRFVMTLRTRLGPLLHNAPLLYQGAPELKDVLQLFDVDITTPKEALSTSELRVRFQTLVEQVFAVIAEVRLLALFLDDLHEADESSLDLIQTLANSKSRMLILASVRSEDADRVARLRQAFGSKSRVTWINLEPLSFSAVASLVAKTLHSPKEKCLPLSRIIYRTSGGNAFTIRNFLFSLQRHHHIVFDWEQNCWSYDLQNIEASLVDEDSAAHPNIQTYLNSHWRELPPEARKYLLWASFFGTIFKAEEVALVIDWEDSSSGSSTSEEDSDESFRLIKPISNLKESTNFSSTRTSMKGLQAAIAEGWLVQRARDMCSFSHDRYRQAAVAEAEKLSDEMIAKMSFRIVLMHLHEQNPDPHRVAEHAKRCMNIIRSHPVRNEVHEQLYEAGTAAWTRGAHELALESLKNAQALLVEEQWETGFERTFTLLLKLSELYSWKGDLVASDEVITETIRRAKSVEDTARCLRLRSRNKFASKDFAGALEDTLSALETLGVIVNPSPSRKEVDIMFEQVKNEILAVGFENILKIPRTDNPRIDLTVQLLNDAGMNAYWNTGDGFSDVLGLTTIQVALRSGMCPGTAIGFFWALGAAAERRDLYRFSADLGRLGLRIAEAHGTSAEKCRSLYLYCSMVSGYDNLHIKANIPRCEMAVKYGLSAGDRLFAGFALIHGIMNRLYTGEHLSELVQAGEEALTDISTWTPQSDTITLARGVLNLIRALGGYTIASSAGTAFDTETFSDAEYVQHVIHTSGNVPLALGWYNAFKVIGLFCLGFIEEASELGFSVYESLHYHPNHRHTRFALCYHSLAMIACIRERKLSEDRRSRYLKQVELNQTYIRKWLSPSPVNTSTWITLVDAELASISGDPDAFRLYDIAVRLASNNDWLLEEGWALYFQGCHFVRCGVEGLGSELQRRGISRQSQWGARGIVNNLTTVVGISSQTPLKKTIFTSDVGVQTDTLIRGPDSSLGTTEDPMTEFNYEEEAFQLTSSDLAAILRWSKDISSDINLSSALRRLTEIATENSGAQCACVVIAREAGDYTVATSMYPPKPCQVHENPKSIRAIADPLQRAVIQHCLNSKSRIVFDHTTLDSRFASEAQDSPYKAVICLPIFSNRGQTFGVVYLASRYTFLQSTVHILTLFLQQASISISNALLFRSVQAGTRENLKMISSQRAALEEARKSREDALKATKIKSNFLASMSHELRTPFSSFYGLLDILSGTELNSSQLEIVSTAKESCELLLKIIDSILDYSKLEASALKLEMSGFPVENIIADCMELLLPMAAKKLDMSFNIEPDVPLWVKADYARIRQVLMNLIGNAVKFTASGSVKVICSVDDTRRAQEGEVYIKFVIQDTGIGLSKADKELLFVPFQQADNSSTRKFGGTGLGLSISRQLVKLMGGEIGVESEPGVGSIFWFSIPVKIFESEDSRKSVEELKDLKARLLKPHPPRILITTPSDATAALLSNMLDGFAVSKVGSIEEAEERLHSTDTKVKAADFIVVDHQSEARVDELAKTLQATKSASTDKTKIIHLFTPTAESLSKQPTIDNAQLGVVRMTKPPRKARMLQTLAALKDLKSTLTADPHSDVSKAMGDSTAVRRTLFGNVLIAEDNPVAQQLLIMQLERHKLVVTATSNGEEAVKEWESHDPGYYSIALFDHHMPICDGIEACKRIRLLENKRKTPVTLPIIALSADCQDSTKQLCLSAGMNAFLSKPLKKGDLVTLLSMLDPSDPPAG